jgi:NADH-quinone oxidoreductase subunit J
MTPDLLLFFLLALVAVASALGLLFSQNPVYSALYLIVNFATVAIFYLLLGAPFIALAQVTVYAGAIMVLFLFVIMLLGAEKMQYGRTLPWQRPLAIFLGVLLLFEAGYIIFFDLAGAPGPEPGPPILGNPEEVALRLFNQYLVPFEVTSILLLVAMIGAIVLTKRKREA